MEWLGLVCWAVALLMASGVAVVTPIAPSIGLVPPIAIGGLATCVLYLATAGHGWLAWLSAGLAVAGSVTVASAVPSLISDAPRPPLLGQRIEEHAAMLAGALLPLLLTTAFAMILAAVGVTTVD